MKKILVFLVVVAAVSYAIKPPKDSAAGSSDDPQVIVNPVYAETRVQMEIEGRSIEGVALGKAINPADCQKQLKVVSQQLETMSARLCPQCKVTTSECKTDLAPRYERLFDNEPSHVTYLSIARGVPEEREYRLIYWGLTVAETDMLCGAVPQLQRKHRGTVSCVRSARG